VDSSSLRKPAQSPFGQQKQVPLGTRQFEFMPTLAEARETARSGREFLAGCGLNEQELFACELALTEACNNAVHHVTTFGRDKPVVVDVSCSGAEVTLAVHDRTAGFDWLGRVPAPKPEIERGRGLYLIQSMMDEVRYVRGSGANTLIMRKRLNRPS
jgi:anti-sigma regulatory factor (Ser/Thr protein kinase)